MSSRLFRFLSPYGTRPQEDTGNCLNWDVGHIPHNQLSAVLNEAVAGFAHLYANGGSKCTLISQLLGRPVHNLDVFNRLSPCVFIHNFRCTKPCQRNAYFRCASKHAHCWCTISRNVLLPALVTRRVILPALFQRYKTAQISYLHKFSVAMPSRTRPMQPLDEQATRRASELPFALTSRSSVRPFPTGYSYAASFWMTINGMCQSDSTPRRIINHWTSLGTKLIPLVLTAEYVTIVAERLSGLVEAMCEKEQFQWKSEDKVFRVNSKGSYRVARLTLDKHWMSFKLHELRNLLYIFYMITINCLCI